MDEKELGDRIAANLKCLLEEVGVAETRLSRDAGLSHTVIRDIISRKTKNPTYATLAKIAETAGVNVQRLLIGTGNDVQKQQEQEILTIIRQLEPEEIRLILNVAKEQISSRKRMRK